MLFHHELPRELFFVSTCLSLYQHEFGPLEIIVTAIMFDLIPVSAPHGVL